MAAKKILVADDSLTIQKVIRLALSNEGYEIQAVSEGNDAIQQISLFRPNVVLIDVSLPGQSAFDVKSAVDALDDLRGTKFILMSSAFEKIDEDRVNSSHFHGRLTKPFDPSHLRQVLTDVLSGATLQPHSISDFEQNQVSMPPLPSKGSVEPPPVKDLPPDPPFAQSPPAIPKDEPTNPALLLDPDKDIRDLTESTIQMSGLDDFEWSVQEPSLKPPPAILDDGGTSFRVERPPLPEISIPNSDEELPVKETVPPPRFQREPTEQPAEVSAVPLEANLVQIDALVRKQVEETLGKMAKQILPDIAEKIIKSEIHRLLNEQL